MRSTKSVDLIGHIKLQCDQTLPLCEGCALRDYTKPTQTDTLCMDTKVEFTAVSMISAMHDLAISLVLTTFWE